LRQPRGASKAPVQNRRRRDASAPPDSEDADEVDSSSDSNDINDGPTPAEQYGLILRRDASNNSGGDSLLSRGIRGSSSIGKF